MPNEVPQHKTEEKRSLGSTSNSLVIVDGANLKSLEARPSFSSYLVQLWQRRHFVRAEAKNKSFSEGRDMFLGNVWIILNPLLRVAIYALVFGLVLRVSRGMDNFIGFLVIGVIYFGFVSSALAGSTNLIRSSRGIISSFSFPKASLVLSMILRQALDNIVPSFVAIMLALAFQPTIIINWTYALLPLHFLLLHIFAAGFSFFIARTTAFVPDFKGVVNLVSRGLFFVSGVFFPLSRFDGHPVLVSIMQGNPVYELLTIARSIILEGSPGELEMWIHFVLWSFGLFIFGLLYFWQAEARYASVK